jgi:hypothetical protein
MFLAAILASDSIGVVKFSEMALLIMSRVNIAILNRKRSQSVESRQCETLFEQIHGVDPLTQVRDRVHVQVHTQAVPRLIRHQLRIDAGLSRKLHGGVACLKEDRSLPSEQ